MIEHGRPRAGLVASAAAAALLLVACTGSAGPTSAAHAQSTPSAVGVLTESVLGVTAAGGMVLLDPVRGTRAAPAPSSVGGVTDDEVSVSADGSTIYYGHTGPACTNWIYSIGRTGGGPTPVAAGSLPALSPDGSRLAYARQGRHSCDEAAAPAPYTVVVRNLKSGTETSFPAAPRMTATGLQYPISHLSWAADSRRLLVSVGAVQDNEGWSLVVLDARTARYYLTGAPGESIPLSANADRGSYYREGAFMPDGRLFVNTVCCAGMHAAPLRSSTVLQELDLSGAQVEQVAIGFADRDHTSLAVDRAGKELLYLSGTDLYVSDGGQRPRMLGGGLSAATWITYLCAGC